MRRLFLLLVLVATSISAPNLRPAFAQSHDSSGSNQLPDWLVAAKEQIAAFDRQRGILRSKVSVDFNSVPLQQVVEELGGQVGSQLDLNLPELDLIGVEPGMEITLKRSATLNEVLRILLDPLELDFCVRQTGIEISSKDAVNSEPVTRYYDATWVLDSSEQVNALSQAIEMSIDPDSWIAVGGTSCIALVGTTMIITAPETTQQKIEDMFANLLRMRELRKR